MIIGIGSDLIDIRRIEKVIERHGKRFIKRIFTTAEQEHAEGKRGRLASYAKRFAAKEACAKALGCGIAEGVFWTEMGVVKMLDGQPIMKLTDGAAARLSKITPVGHRTIVHLTITDNFPFAQAFVIIEAVLVEQPPLS